jgi:UDP-N-acetylmuramoylalanine--D-glutamate ligase
MELAINQPRQHSVIAGLSATGLSVARFLLARGEDVVVADTREKPAGLAELLQQYPHAKVVTGPFAESLLDKATRLIVSPGIPLTIDFVQQARRRGLPVVGDIELFAQMVNAPVVAVTGSNGKSTVVTLLAEMAKIAGVDAPLGGNIGIPALDILRLENPPEFYILELSSFQLDSTRSLRPRAAAVLNVTADHLDRYESLEHYAASKQTIYRNCSVAVVNTDDDAAIDMVGGSSKIRYGLNDPLGNDYRILLHGDETWLARRGKRLMRVGDMKTPGLHNISNALAALALGEAMGLPVPAMIQALIAFPGLPHRTQYVGTVNNVRWYNDSKGTNVGATLAAIKGFASPVVLIAGGVGKGADFTPLTAAVERHARAVVLIGEDAKAIEEALAGVSPVIHATSMKDAVRKAADVAEHGDAVLLSPACASMDMFANYGQRGDVFVEAVKAL